MLSKTLDLNVWPFRSFNKMNGFKVQIDDTLTEQVAFFLLKNALLDLNFNGNERGK